VRERVRDAGAAVERGSRRAQMSRTVGCAVSLHGG